MLFLIPESPAGLLFSSCLEDTHKTRASKAERLRSRHLSTAEADHRRMVWKNRNRNLSGDALLELMKNRINQEVSPREVVQKLGADAKILSKVFEKKVRPKTLNIRPSSLAPSKKGDVDKESSDEDAPFENSFADKTESPVIFDLEDLDNEPVSTKTVKPSNRTPRRIQRAISFPVKAAEMTGVETGFDPLSLLAAETKRLPEDEEEADDKSASTPSARRDLAEEIEMYMNNMSSPLTSRAPSVDLQKAYNDRNAHKNSPTRAQSCRRSSLPPNSPRPVHLTKSKSYQVKNEERVRNRLWSSPTFSPSNRAKGQSEDTASTVELASPTSFNLDTLLTPTFDVLKSSMFSAGKGVAEKASRWYSKFATYTGSSKVSFSSAGVSSHVAKNRNGSVKSFRRLCPSLNPIQSTREGGSFRTTTQNLVDVQWQ